MTAKESATGVLFPDTITVPGMKELHFVGSGVRENKVGFVSIKPYALAAYIDPDAASVVLSPFKGISGGKLAKDDAFYKAMAQGTFDKVFTLCFVRDLSADQFVSGLAENMQPRLNAFGSGPEPLKAFSAPFAGLPLTIGTRVYIGLSGPATTQVVIVPSKVVPSSLQVPSGIKPAVVDSAALVSAFNEAYFGKDVGSPTLKAAIAEGAALLLK